MSDGERPEPIRIGLVGYGAVAQVAHLPAYRRLRSVELAGICERDPSKLRALRSNATIPRAVSDLDDLLAIDEIDAVDICLPTHLHADAVIRALEAGKHVLCEKPLAPTVAEVDRILAAREASGKVVLAGMNNRYRPDSIVLKRFVEEGTLGEIFYAHSSWLRRRGRIRSGAWHFRGDTAGGVMMDLGVHLLDLSLWLTDYPAVERASATYWRHNPEIEVEDSAVVQLTCAEGLTIGVEVSWSFLMDVERPGRRGGGDEPQYDMRLYGSEGAALIKPLRVFQRMHGDLVDVTPQEERPGGNVYMESIEREIAFFAEVAAGREEAPPVEENRALARAIEAIRRSAEIGREVAISDSPDAGPDGPGS